MTKKQSFIPQFHCGMVAIVGRPNVGKSTLLNTIVGEKIAIVSPIPQTTRNRIRGIYTDERCQVIFIDTPGIHANRDTLDQCMNKAAYGTATDVDCVIHLVDANKSVGPDEEEVVKKLNDLKVPVIVGLNKVDLKGTHIPEYIELWERVSGRPAQEIAVFTLLPLSGKTGKNTDKLIDILYENLPVGPALYPEDTVCDIPQKMVIADIIREKLLELLRDELPHSVAVIVENMASRRKKTLYIQAAVLVERSTHKPMVIGKNGQTLKKVGSLARQELEELLATKIFLEIFVKIKKRWRDDVDLLQEMGYSG